MPKIVVFATDQTHLIPNLVDKFIELDPGGISIVSVELSAEQCVELLSNWQHLAESVDGP